jgi:hypothetical protein
MIRRTQELDAIERRYLREQVAELTYGEALAVFAALWREAQALNPDYPYDCDWRVDIEPDLAIARAINGLPPGT